MIAALRSVRWLVPSALAVSAVMKLSGLGQVGGDSLMPSWFSFLVGAGEMLLFVYLVWQGSRVAPWIVASLFVASATTVLMVAASHGISADQCGCFGPIVLRNTSVHLAINGILLGCAGIGVVVTSNAVDRRRDAT